MKKKKDEKEMILGIDLIPVDCCSIDVYFCPKENEYRAMLKINNPEKNCYIFLVEENRVVE